MLAVNQTVSSVCIAMNISTGQCTEDNVDSVDVKLSLLSISSIFMNIYNSICVLFYKYYHFIHLYFYNNFAYLHWLIYLRTAFMHLPSLSYTTSFVFFYFFICHSFEMSIIF